MEKLIAFFLRKRIFKKVENSISSIVACSALRLTTLLIYIARKDKINVSIDKVFHNYLEKKKTNRTIIKSNDNWWSSDLLNMNDNKGAHNTGYSFILAVKETFSKFRRTKPLNFKYAQTKIGEFLKKKPNMET